ncbi:MAG: peptide deformylase [Acidobacteria bacterium]|nr:MAG: peptide deformylase [Acidobacteriota bacterium]
MLLRIAKYGAESLRKVSAPVESFDRELERIARDMVETMYGAPGIGLAAPQVGLNIRLATIDLSVGEDPSQLIKICNPEIVASEGEQKSEEGCLSIPEFTDTITRPRKLVVKGLDLHGNEIRFEAEGLLARCFSHEIDHLNGMLFVDRLSALKRNLILNKIRKMAKAGEW